jgi:hypothetical protein
MIHKTSTVNVSGFIISIDANTVNNLFMSFVSGGSKTHREITEEFTNATMGKENAAEQLLPTAN